MRVKVGLGTSCCGSPVSLGFVLADAGEFADQRARQRRLAGAEIARERDEIARLDQRRDASRERGGRRLVGKLIVETHLFRQGGSPHPVAAFTTASALSGNRQVTTVPWPGADCISTSPPCSSTNERTI